MTTTSHTVSDSLTMFRRDLRHQLRYPSLTLMLVGMPIVFLLLFVYVLGGTLGAGLGRPSGGRADYIAYVVPGILVLTVAAGTAGTAISVATDMTEGIIARFRTMAIARTSVLTGHVLGACAQTMVGLAAVTAVAIAVGFRSSTVPLRWLAAVGVLLMITFALTWVAVALGCVAKSVESASNMPMVLLLLPFLGSGFVPTASLPSGMSWFAQHQPFTPFIESVRGLLVGTPIGNSAVLTIVWCIAISIGGYLWARSAYERHAVR